MTRVSIAFYLINSAVSRYGCFGITRCLCDIIMPPYIYTPDEEDLQKPFQYLHPGIRKGTFSEQKPEAHVFQQSVTLTASMWNENESKGKMDWNWDNWRVLGKYSPLFVGLVCGFGIVLIIMSTVMLWRYCLVTASKKVCCKGAYGEVSQHQKSLPLRRESIELGGKFSSFGRPQCQATLQRSATMSSITWHNPAKSPEAEDKPLHSGFSTNNFYFQPHPQTTTTTTTPLEPLMSPDLYTSHSYLQRMEPAIPLESAKSLSLSTPALEDLYAQVNFSKKKKNRMRKNEAAIIAMSKSHSGQSDHSQLFGSGIVVYNERTAL